LGGKLPDEPFNPLDKLSLARSIEGELLKRVPTALEADFGQLGAGVYALYYTGGFPLYAPISRVNINGGFALPIYVGKAIPKGGRKGGMGSAPSDRKSLSDRLRKHGKSLSECKNLSVGDFYFRSLAVDDIWIPLGENMLIESYKPIWNRVIDGFGNNKPGSRRELQYKSDWDLIHPGRSTMARLPEKPGQLELAIRRAEKFLATITVAKAK
jgi:hypothetical protein